METKWLIAIALAAIIFLYFYPVPSNQGSSVGADVEVVFKDGSSRMFTGNPLENLFQQAITLPGDNRQVERFIIKVYFIPDTTGTVTSWSFKADVGVWLWYGPMDEESIVTTSLSDSGSTLENGKKYFVGSITVLASTIEQKLNNRNAEDGEYALILKLKYAKLSVTFDTGVSDTYEISYSTYQNILTIDFNFAGDKINNVSVGGSFSVGFQSMVKPIEEVVEIWT